jgi:thiosulfate dehydrogenase
VVASLEDRVNYCFTRSLAGDALPTRGREMRDIVAYLRFISRGAGPGGHVPGEGMASMPRFVADSARGAAVFLATCARCHGQGGSGSAAVPALWGPRAYSIGASMARVERAASFVRHNMPYDRPGTLSDRDAFDVAAFIDAQARPDSPGKEHDWPKGDAPADVPYDTRAHRAVDPPPVLPRAQRSSSSISREEDAGAPAPAATVSVRR